MLDIELGLSNSTSNPLSIGNSNSWHIASRSSRKRDSPSAASPPRRSRSSLDLASIDESHSMYHPILDT